MPYDWDVLDEVRPGRDRLRAGRRARRGNEDAGHIQMAGVRARARLRREDRSAAPDLGLGHSRLARARRARSTRSCTAARSRRRRRRRRSTPASRRTARSRRDRRSTTRSSGRTNFVVDSTTEVLLERMQNIARLIGVVSLLVALPLLWMAWVLGRQPRRAADAERAPHARTDAAARHLGPADGARAADQRDGRRPRRRRCSACIAGSVVPLLIYERGRLPLERAARRAAAGDLRRASSPSRSCLALVVSRRLVKYATTISPLEASVRVSGSEAPSASMRFGVLQVVRARARRLRADRLDLRLRDLGPRRHRAGSGSADRLLDFLGLPLFLYGVATLLASKRERIQQVMAPVLRPIGGVLGRFALRHMSAKPHRTVAFLLIVALMSSVSLYPIVTSRSFEDKAVRGAKVQIGTDWQMLFNAPDLIDVDRAERAGRGAARARSSRRSTSCWRRCGRSRACATRPTWSSPCCRPSTCRATACAACRSSCSANPRDLPIDASTRSRTVGLSAAVRRHHGAARGTADVAVSPPVADFWRLEPGTPDAPRPRRGAAGGRPRTRPASWRSCRGFRPRASTIARATCRRASTT